VTLTPNKCVIRQVYQFDLAPAADYSPMIERTFDFENTTTNATDCYNQLFSLRPQDLGAPLAFAAGDSANGYTSKYLLLRYYGGFGSGTYACYSGGFAPNELSFFRFVLDQKCSMISSYGGTNTARLDQNGQAFFAAAGATYGAIIYQAAACTQSKPLPVCPLGQNRVCSSPSGLLNPLSDFYNIDPVTDQPSSAKCFKGWTHNCSCVDQ
jgi:hypothetical protein